MRPDDRIRLQHMLDAAQQACLFVVNRRREELVQDRQLVWALVKALEIIGEAAQRVSPEVRTTISGIPWEKITGMRHRLVHAYFDIDLDILWKTVKEGLPPLMAALRTSLGEPGESEGPSRPGPA